MTEYMRVNVCGRVTLAEERFSGGGRRLARLCVATGGDAVFRSTKDEGRGTKLNGGAGAAKAAAPAPLPHEDTDDIPF